MSSIHDLIRCRKASSPGGIAQLAFGEGEKSARYLRNKVRKVRPLTTDESVAIEKVLMEAGITLGG